MSILKKGVFTPAIPSVYDLKGEAIKLREEAAASGKTKGHKTALKEVAYKYGFRSWQALEAVARENDAAKSNHAFKVAETVVTAGDSKTAAKPTVVHFIYDYSQHLVIVNRHVITSANTFLGDEPLDGVAERLGQALGCGYVTKTASENDQFNEWSDAKAEDVAILLDLVERPSRFPSIEINVDEPGLISSGFVNPTGEFDKAVDWKGLADAFGDQLMPSVAPADIAAQRELLNIGRAERLIGLIGTNLDQKYVDAALKSGKFQSKFSTSDLLLALDDRLDSKSYPLHHAPLGASKEIAAEVKPKSFNEIVAIARNHEDFEIDYENDIEFVILLGEEQHPNPDIGDIEYCVRVKMHVEEGKPICPTFRAYVHLEYAGSIEALPPAEHLSSVAGAVWELLNWLIEQGVDIDLTQVTDESKGKTYDPTNVNY